MPKSTCPTCGRSCNNEVGCFRHKPAVKDYVKKYYQEHSEKLKQQAKDYYNDHREHVIQRVVNQRKAKRIQPEQEH